MFLELSYCWQLILLDVAAIRVPDMKLHWYSQASGTSYRANVKG